MGRLQVQHLWVIHPIDPANLPAAPAAGSQAAEGSATLIKYEGRQHAFVLREFNSDDARHALMAMRDFIPGLGTTPA